MNAARAVEQVLKNSEYASYAIYLRPLLISALAVEEMKMVKDEGKDSNDV